MNPLQLLLIAGAGYLAWRYYSDGAGTTTPPTAGTPSGSTGNTGTNTTPTGGSGGGNGGSGGGSSTTVDIEDVKAAAAGGDLTAVAAADAANVRLNIDQWNFYREVSGAAAISPDAMPGLIGSSNRGDLILASEYRARLAANGLAGLGVLWL